MQCLQHETLKHGFSTHRVPLAAMVGFIPFATAPQLGNLVLAEVLQLGKHSSLEGRDGWNRQIFPGDRIVGVFGNRYATDQYEGYVPATPVEECDMLSVGGVCGEVTSSHSAMNIPTRLRVLGVVTDNQGQALRLQDFGLAQRTAFGQAETILVVGASMNSGKTTTVGTLVRSLSQAGRRVAAAKITGTAAGKDGRYFLSCGAHQVLDFTDAGYPSTYMLGLDELQQIAATLIGTLEQQNPDYVLIEIADGIFQRETRMLLESLDFCAGIDHVFFAANDSLSAECGVRRLQSSGLPLRALSGAFTQSPLAIAEAEAYTGMPCLTIDDMIHGKLWSVLPSRLTSSRVAAALPFERWV
jgi:hypothetical protein